MKLNFPILSQKEIDELLKNISGHEFEEGNWIVPASTVIYRIMNENGLFSTGGEYPEFVTHGRNFSTKGHIKQHLRYLKKWHRLRNVYKKCAVVEFVLGRNQNGAQLVNGWMKENAV